MERLLKPLAARLWLGPLLLLLCLVLPAGQAPAQDDGPEAGYAKLEQLEKAYLAAYQTQLEAGKRFKSALKQLKPPPWHGYTGTDLAGFNRMLRELYRQKPEYRDMGIKEAGNDPATSQLAKLAGVSLEELARFEGAIDLSRMTGLPLRDLVIYRRANGPIGLQYLVYSVENLANPQWVSWYFFMQQSKIDQKSLFGDQDRSEPELAGLRDTFVRAIEAFNQRALALGAHLREMISLAKDPVILNRLAAKAHVYNQIFKVAGRIDIFGVRAGEYPLQDPNPELFPQAAALAQRLAVPFPDLAYVQRRSGIEGLRDYLERLLWIVDKQGLYALLPPVR